jgi:acyl-coenzyme A synthetase/AMP-(fatty) acid ligase
MTEPVIISVIAAVPPTLAAMAAFVKIRQVNNHVAPNGSKRSLVHIIEELEAKVITLQREFLHWTAKHNLDHARSSVQADVADAHMNHHEHLPADEGHNQEPR